MGTSSHVMLFSEIATLDLAPYRFVILCDSVELTDELMAAGSELQVDTRSAPGATHADKEPAAIHLHL